MEIRVLRYFLIVAREENITKASQLLHITQPTLSRQLIQLEEELGVKLFHRSRHNISLTEDGLLLRRRAQEIVSLADKTIDGFSSNQHEIAGEISIGAGEFLSIECLCQMMNTFRENNPLIHFDMHSDNTEGIEERIEKGLLDFGILSSGIDISKYGFVHLPHQERWGILTRKDSILANKKVVELSDLDQVPMIIPKKMNQQSEIVRWFKEGLDSLEIVATYNLLYNAAMMVSSGMGIALCIQLASTYEDLCFIPLAPSLHTETLLIWKKNQTLTPSVSAFIEHLKKCQKSISQDMT